MKSPMSVDVNNVSWTEPRNKQKILHPVSFNLDPGKILGIVGPNERESLRFFAYYIGIKNQAQA